MLKMDHNKLILTKIFVIAFLFMFSVVGAMAYSGFEKSWGGSNYEYIYSMTLDSNNNMYIAGHQRSNTQGDYDFYMAKLDSNGNKLWEKSWGGSNYELLKSLTVDSNNNIYVVGYQSSNTQGNNDFYVAKLDTNGNKLWEKSWGGNYNDMLYSVIVDSNNNIYVAGTQESSSQGQYDFYVTKLDTNGNKLWEKSWGGNYNEWLYSIAVDSNNNIYVAGIQGSNSQDSYDFYVAKLDTNGNKLWEKSWGGSNYNYLRSITIDSNNNIYVAGIQGSNSQGGFDFYVAKLDSNGNKLWEKSWGGSNSDELHSITSDSNSNIYIADYQRSNSQGSNDFYVAKLDTNGNKLWEKSWGGSNSDVLQSIILDSNNNIYVAGIQGSNSQGGNDFYILKTTEQDLLNEELYSVKDGYFKFDNLNFADDSLSFNYDSLSFSYNSLNFADNSLNFNDNNLQFNYDFAFSELFPYWVPYWIEHDENGNPNGNVWAKTNINNTLSFYVYYNPDDWFSGNSGATTFDFFDDFEGTSLDTNKWDTFGSGSISITNNLLKISTSSSTTLTTGIASKIKISTPFIVESLLSSLSNGNGELTTFESSKTSAWYKNNDWISTIYYEKSSNSVKGNVKFNGNWQTGQTISSESIPTILKSIIAPDYVKLCSKSNCITYNGILPDSYISLNHQPNPNAGYYWIDWLFVRKYASTEPTITYGSEETGSWELMGTTFTKRRKVTVTSSEALSDYQIALDYYMFNSTNLYISLETYDVNLNQTLNYDEPKVNHNITQQCYWYNASEQPSSVNITLEAINTDDSTTLYSQTFNNISENETASYQYTIQNTDAHNDITFKCIYNDAEGNSKETATTLTVENTEPTQPTAITIDPTDVFVNTTITANASGSSDVDEDNIIYEYKFYNVNDNSVVQNWSTTNNYTIQVSDAHDVIRVYARAFDNYNYSDVIQNETTILNTNPTITNLAMTEPVIASDNTIVNLSISDLDNDNAFTVRVYANDHAHLIETINNYNSTKLNITVPVSYANQNVTFLFNVSDAYSGSDEANQSKLVYWGKMTPTYLDEKTHEALNLSAITSSNYVVTYTDGVTKEYNFTQSALLIKPVDYITFNAQYETYNEYRSRTITAGTHNLTVYLIDLTTTPWVLTTFYVLGVDGGKLEIYTPNEGIISTQKLDVSQSAQMYMIQNKEYQVRLLYDDSVRELGHVIRSTNSIIQLQFSQVIPTLTNARNNIIWGAEFLSDSLLKVYYNDTDKDTSKVCVNVRDRENTVYHSCIEGYSTALWSDVNINSSKTYEVKLTITKSGETWDEIKYFRYGREVATPVDIPSWFLKLGSVAIIVLVAALGSVFNAGIILMLDVVLASLFTYFGWIVVPIPLLALLGLVSIFVLLKRGDR